MPTRLSRLLAVGLLATAALPLLLPPPAAGFAAATLSPGDIAIIGFNFDNPDEVAFVLLAGVPAGTQISFTDNGWRSDNTFRTGEGTNLWTASAPLAAGTVITFAPSGMALSTSGDQILAYQGAETSPTFLYALNSEGSGWQADATSSNTSALPQGLTEGLTAVALPEVDNAAYTGPTSGSRASLLASIGDPANWTGSNSTRQAMPGGPFTVTGQTPPGALKVAKHAPAQVVPGGRFTYTLIVTNSTGITLTGAVITDALPRNVTVAGTGGGGTLAGGAVISWTIPGEVAPGLTVTRTFQVTATLQNNVVITNARYGARAANWLTPTLGSPVTTTVSGDPRLSIGKTVAPADGVPRRGLVTYTITLANSGTAAASAARLTDTLPLSVTFARWLTAPPGSVFSGGQIRWAGTVSAGQSLRFSFVATHSGGYAETVTNAARFAHPSGGGSDVAPFTVQARPFSGTVIINEIMQNPAAVSDSAGEWLELYNPGSAPVDLSGCILRDDDTDAHTIAGPLTILPGGFAVLGRNGNPAENGGLTLAYTYTGFTLANGGDEVVLRCGSTEVDRVAYDGGTTFPAPAGASMQLLAPALDNSAGDNWCVAAAPWPGSAGDYGSPGAANLCPTTVTLSKHGPAWALPGSVVSYTIALTNTGPAAAVGGVLTDVLPPQAQFGGWLAPAPTGSLVAGSLPTWAGTLPGGMTFTLRFTATLTAAPGDILTNTARFRAQNAAAAAKTALTVIARPPAPLPLLLTKTVVPTAAALPGGAVTYTIALSNSPAAAPAAAALGDVLPPQVRFGAWLSQSGAVRAGRVVTWAGVLAPGERRVWRFTAAVSTGTVLYGATVTNTARYTAGKVSGAAQAHFKITSAPPPVPFKRRVYVPLILHLYPRVARISVRPPAGPVGTTFQFHLSGFIPAEGVSLWLIQPGGAQTTLPNAVINPDGTYDAGLAVVYGSPWPPGAYTVCARGEQSQTTVCAGFVLTG